MCELVREREREREGKRKGEREKERGRGRERERAPFTELTISAVQCCILHMPVNCALWPNVIEDYICDYFKFSSDTVIIQYSLKYSVIVLKSLIHILTATYISKYLNGFMNEKCSYAREGYNY